MNESDRLGEYTPDARTGRIGRSKSSDLFAPIVEAAPMGLMAVGLDGRIRFANREAARLFGYGADEIAGQFIEKLVPGAMHAQRTRVRAASDEWPPLRPIGAGRELLARRRDGTSVPVEVVLKPIAFAAAVFTLAVVVDISARKRLERQFAKALEAAPIAMLTLDASGRIASVNHEAEALYGYGRDELVGKPVELLVPERLRAHDPLLRARFFGSAVAHRLGATPREIHGLRKDGSEFPLEVGLSTIPDGPDQMKLVTVIDATERKRWEAALRRSRERATLAKRSLRNAGAWDTSVPFRRACRASPRERPALPGRRRQVAAFPRAWHPAVRTGARAGPDRRASRHCPALRPG